MGSTSSTGATAAVPALSRWGPAVVALLLTAALAWFLGRPGYTNVRLAFFSLLALVAWAGAAGAALGRPAVVGAGALALFLLGFWQAVLWVLVLPAAFLLFLAAVSIRDRESVRATG